MSSFFGCLWIITMCFFDLSYPSTCLITSWESYPSTFINAVSSQPIINRGALQCIQQADLIDHSLLSKRLLVFAVILLCLWYCIFSISSWYQSKTANPFSYFAERCKLFLITVVRSRFFQYGQGVDTHGKLRFFLYVSWASSFFFSLWVGRARFTSLELGELDFFLSVGYASLIFLSMSWTNSDLKRFGGHVQYSPPPCKCVQADLTTPSPSLQIAVP
jgi:hypothetical protein